MSINTIICDSSPLHLSPESWPFSSKVALFHVQELRCCSSATSKEGVVAPQPTVSRTSSAISQCPQFVFNNCTVYMGTSNCMSLF